MAFFAFFAVLFSCASAHADAGIMLFAVITPAAVLLLIPIILIEAWIYRKELSLGWRCAFAVSSFANSLSTLFGVPLASASSYFSQLWLARWLQPHSHDIELFADFYFVSILTKKLNLPDSAGLALMVLVVFAVLGLCYQASVWSEYFVVARFCRGLAAGRILEVVRRSNRLTYVGLVVVIIGALVAMSMGWAPRLH